MAIVNQIKATSTNETRDIHDIRLQEDNGTIKVAENIESSGDVKGASATFPTINGESSPSIKPIYCHPVYLQYNRGYDDGIVQITMLIFNNSATAFTKQTFVDWLKDLFTNYPLAKVLCSGFYKTAPVCCIKISDTPNSNAFLEFASTDTAGTSAYLQYSDVLAETTILEDGVNKIN